MDWSTRVKSVVVLISGSGSNLQAIIDRAKQESSFKIAGVLSNNPLAYGLQRASQDGISTAVIDHRDYESRSEFDAALVQQIDHWDADLVVLAGFMRILTDEFVRHYSGKLINIHPSLLPKYKGLNTHQRALDAGDTEHGCTVHFVSEELDAGFPIVHACTPITASDTEQTLIARIHLLEHQIYPLAVQWFCEDRLVQCRDGAYLDSNKLGPSGVQYQPT